jgi:hypothetical protein
MSEGEQIFLSAAILFSSGPHQVGNGTSSLFSLLIQMLMDSKNTPTQTPRNNILPVI